MSAPAKLPLCKHRYAILVSYLGTKYLGSQRLTHRSKPGSQETVQEAIEWSLESFIPRAKCRITAASRTDRGVHALMNCFTLPLQDYKVPTETIRRQCNYNLIKNYHDIQIRDVILVDPEFHPRKMANSREYIYRIAIPNRKFKSINFNLKKIAAELSYTLPVNELYKVLPLPYFDVEKAERAMELLRGHHDFASFVFKMNDNEDALRHLEISMVQADSAQIDTYKSKGFSLYHLKFKSKSFLHNQVRRLVGSILSYASFDIIELKEIQYLLDNPATNNWPAHMVIAEPYGLFLSRINYDRSGSLKVNENSSQEEVNGFEDEFMEWSDTETDSEKESEVSVN